MVTENGIYRELSCTAKAERRFQTKKEEGTAAGETAASSASGSAVSGNNFTSRYLALRKQSSGVPGLPGLSLPALPDAPAKTGGAGIRSQLMAEAMARHPVAEGAVKGLSLPAVPETGAQGPKWAQQIVDRYKPENNRNIRGNPVAQYEAQKKASEKGVDWRGIPMSQSPDRVRSQEWKKPTAAQRAGDVLSGAAKTYGASLANTGANMYDLTQGGRDVMNQEYLEAAQLEYDWAKRDYDETAEMLRLHPGDPYWEKALKASKETFDGVKQKLEAYGAVQEVQRNATQQSYAAADQLAASGRADVERAKAGLNGLGMFAVDVGAVERIGKTEAGRKALNRAASAGAGFLSEGAEEFVSGIVSPLLKQAIYSKEPIDWKETMEES